jgi:hypothetical protein
VFLCRTSWRFDGQSSDFHVKKLFHKTSNEDIMKESRTDSKFWHFVKTIVEASYESEICIYRLRACADVFLSCLPCFVTSWHCINGILVEERAMRYKVDGSSPAGTFFPLFNLFMYIIAITLILFYQSTRLRLRLGKCSPKLSSH